MELLDRVREAIQKNIIVHPREHGEIRGNVGVKEKAMHPLRTPPIVRLSSRRSQGRGIFSRQRPNLMFRNFRRTLSPLRVRRHSGLSWEIYLLPSYFKTLYVIFYGAADNLFVVLQYWQHP